LKTGSTVYAHLAVVVRSGSQRYVAHKDLYRKARMITLILTLEQFQALGTPDQESTFTADNGKDLLSNGGPSLSALGIQYAFSPYGSGSGAN
jgi:hypothetical protein